MRRRLTGRAPTWLWLAVLAACPARPPRRCFRCSCPRSGHEHYRAGRECGAHGALCPRYLGPIRGALWAAVEVARLLR